jgi:hypothetical protein
MKKRSGPSPTYSETRITLKPQPASIVIRKKYRPISLMSTDAKILHKILANQIQPHRKRIIHWDSS